jgi:hypothetical protein
MLIVLLIIGRDDEPLKIGSVGHHQVKAANFYFG